eukprot:256116_1
MTNIQQIQNEGIDELCSVDWSCPTCTLINNNRLESCEMCGAVNSQFFYNEHTTNSDYYYGTEYYDNQYYEDNKYDGAEYYDYDDVDWDHANKRLTKTQLIPTKKSKRKKKKNKSTITANSSSTQIHSSNASNVENGNIPILKMIYDEKQDIVQRIVVKKFDHPLYIRVMLMLNYDGYSNHYHKAWKLDITGNTSYKKYNYLLSSCRIDIFDKFTNKYWNSMTFLPSKYGAYHLDIVNNCSIPVFVKIKNTKYVEMGKRGTVRDIDTCILYYIAQYCLETRFRNIETFENESNVFIPIIKNGIKWNIKRNIRNKNNIDMDCKSPVYHRKILKLFDKYIPHMHMLFHVIFEYLGYDRITNIIMEGHTLLSNITDTYFNRIAYDNECIPKKRDNKTINKVFENNIEYDIDEANLKMDNGQIVKNYMNVAMILNKENYEYNLQRHEPFKNKFYDDSIWIPAQNPMNSIFRKVNKLKTITLTGKKHRDRMLVY